MANSRAGRSGARNRRTRKDAGAALSEGEGSPNLSAVGPGHRTPVRENSSPSRWEIKAGNPATHCLGRYPRGRAGGRGGASRGLSRKVNLGAPMTSTAGQAQEFAASIRQGDLFWQAISSSHSSRRSRSAPPRRRPPSPDPVRDGFDKREFTCPVGGAKFSQDVGYSTYPLVTFPDGSYPGDEATDAEIPVCPGNGLVLIPAFEKMGEPGNERISYADYRPGRAFASARADRGPRIFGAEAGRTAHPGAVDRDQARPAGLHPLQPASARRLGGDRPGASQAHGRAARRGRAGFDRFRRLSGRVQAPGALFTSSTRFASSDDSTRRSP